MPDHSRASLAADLVLGPRPRGHQAGAQQTLHVEDVVELGLANFPHQLEEPLGAALPLKDVHLVHGLADPHERGEDLPRDPGNAQVLALRLERGGDLKPVDDIPERRGFDDEQFGHGRPASGAKMMKVSDRLPPIQSIFWVLCAC